MSMVFPPVTPELLSLRANIELAGIAHTLRSLVIASVVPTTATGTLLLGLGQAFADVDMDVLLVDADSHAPTLHRLLHGTDTPGLYQCLADRDQALPLQDTPLPGIRLLAAGAQNRDILQVLSRDRIRNRQQELASRARLILWHVPPLTSSPAGFLIASQADATLLVLRPGRVRRSQCQHVQQQLEQAGARILGTVLLRSPDKRVM